MLRYIPGTRALDTVKGHAFDLAVGGVFLKDDRLWIVRLMSLGVRTVTVAVTKYNWKAPQRIFKFRLTDKLRRYIP